MILTALDLHRRIYSDLLSSGDFSSKIALDIDGDFRYTLESVKAVRDIEDPSSPPEIILRIRKNS